MTKGSGSKGKSFKSYFAKSLDRSLSKSGTGLTRREYRQIQQTKRKREEQERLARDPIRAWRADDK